MPQQNLQIDWNNSLSETIGQEGVSTDDLLRSQEKLSRFHRRFSEQSFSDQLSFYTLPDELKQLDPILRTAKRLKENFSNLVVLGIGGSSLGTKAILSVAPRNAPCKVQVWDSIDPDFFFRSLDEIDLSRTVFNVVSKSGNTLETMSQFFVIQNLLKKKIGSGWKERIIITTDPSDGFLREFAKEQNIASLEVPKEIGGRFSVLTPVALFPAAMAGINPEELLNGAKQFRAQYSETDVLENPAYLLASTLFSLNQKNKNIVICMPYSERLVPLAEWFAQLWGESIGKKLNLEGKEVRTGSTPVVASGPKDQHSQLQLYREGPRDKTVIFLNVHNFEEDPLLEVEDENWKMLHRKSLGDLIHAELQATSKALAEVGCPSLKITFPRLTANTLGQAFFMFQLATVAAGELYQINPFDQPGVELIKQITLQILQN